MKPLILIVDDEKNTREGLAATLEEQYEISTASNADEAFRLMEAENFDVIITDLRMAGQSGLSVIDKALSLPQKPVCIMMTAYGNVETAVEAMRRGAYDFLTKPLNLEKLELVIKRALQNRNTERENRAMRVRLDNKFSFQGLIGNSLPLMQCVENAKRVAISKATVLLLGETGTGKELFAQLIHQNSPRAKAPFVPVHCAAIAPTLLESEIFGHEKGAFTGANERRIGRFESANGGTLFLDEIGEIDLATQVKLLRFLETRTIERLGSQKQIQLDVRLVCATNRRLQEMVAAGTFREDLYYRLSVVTLELPPLRERPDDVAALMEHYLKHFAAENALKAPKISPAAMKLLRNYAWPGNIRELRNLCENLVVMHPNADVGEYDLDARFALRQAEPDLPPLPKRSDGNTREQIREVKRERAKQREKITKVRRETLSKAEHEKRLFREALIKAGGDRTAAADYLGISRRTFHRKLLADPSIGEGFAAKRGRRSEADKI